METTDMENNNGKFDILGNLPQELLHEILTYLSADDIDNSFKCCKTWQRRMDYSFLWKSQFLKNYANCLDAEPKTKNYQKFLQKFSCNWKGRYMYYRALELNYINNNYKYVPIQVNSLRLDCFYFDDGMLVATPCVEYYVDELYIINCSTGLVEKTFKHTGLIFATLKYCDLLIAISYDNFHMLIWNIESQECVFDSYLNLNGDDCPRDLDACKHFIFISSTNNHVYQLNTLTGSVDLLNEVTIVDSYNDVIALGKSNMTIEIKDSNLCLLHTINRVMRRRTVDIKIRDDYVVEKCYKLHGVVDDDNCIIDIWIWNIKTNGHFRITSMFGIDITYETKLHLSSNNRLFFQLSERLVGWWDLPTRNCNIIGNSKNSKNYNKYQVSITDLFLFTTELKTPEIKIWRLRNGKYTQNHSVLKPEGFNMLEMATKTKFLYSTDFGIQHIMDFEPEIN